VSTSGTIDLSRGRVALHLLVGLFVVALMAWGVNVLGQRLIDIDRLREWVRGFGPAAPVVFTLTSALAHLVFLPVAPFTVAAAALFNWPVAVTVILVGHNLAANLGYFVPFVLGRERLDRIWESNPRLERFDATLRRHGFWAVLFLRIVPGLPFSLVSYLSAIAGISWTRYALASFLGMLPGPIMMAIVLSHSAPH
jgi:uncharacterized membrane protein YdjX (TVP38/TMEM64 family)